MGKKLAIKGHATRGKEVIKLLEMMGGYCPAEIYGLCENRCYSIKDNGWVGWDYIGPEEIDKYTIFTLEEFLEKYPFKVGDKVHIYVQNDDTDGRYDIEVAKISSMRWNPARCKIAYKMKDINREFYKEEIKCKVDDDKLSGTVDNSTETKSCTVSLKTIEDSIDSVQFIQSSKIVAVRLNTQNYENEVELQLDDYEIVVRDGKTYAVRKKPAYPKTYTECCKVLRISPEFLIKYSVDGNDTEGDVPLIKKFIKLKRCRDAYWKIAGEETGLDGPWKPDWLDETTKYGIHVYQNSVIKDNFIRTNCVLVFPTPEMQDAFYENFKDLIESCKELL